MVTIPASGSVASVAVGAVSSEAPPSEYVSKLSDITSDSRDVEVVVVV
jgi:hypothetical protein